MQRQLSFQMMMLPEGSAPVWALLKEDQRTEVVAMLAHLIAKMVAAPAEAGVATEAEEKGDE